MIELLIQSPEMDRICQLIGVTRELIRAALRAEFDRSSMDYAMLLSHRRRLNRAKRRRARKMARLRRMGRR